MRIGPPRPPPPVQSPGVPAAAAAAAPTAINEAIPPKSPNKRTVATTTTTTTTKRVKRHKNQSSHQHPANKPPKQKLVLQPARGDGNCLFRSVSIQIYGDETWHDRVRADCVDYMRKDWQHFESFVSGQFTQYVDEMSRNGVFGDHVEIQAIAELYNRPVIVFSSDADLAEEGDEEEGEVYIHMPSNEQMKRARMLNIFHSTYLKANSAEAASAAPVPIRLYYRGKSHYDAIIDPLCATVGVGLGLDASFQPGKADYDLLHSATMQTDLDATQQEMERAVIMASLGEANTAASAAAAASNSSFSVRELVANGFSLESVLVAQAIAGDSFDDMLAVLQSSEL